MKRILLILAIFAVAGISSCKKSDFANSYTDPSKISQSTVEKQFAGFMATNREFVLPAYWNYFVVLRTTLQYYNQSVGWVNFTSQYVPGAAAITDRWNNYYNFLAQYRELEKINGKLAADDQKNYRVFMIAAMIYLYDHTQKVVDLHGDIPFTKAGMLSANGGDYLASLPEYDAADKLYTKMLDDLKLAADELSTITVNPGILIGFKNQDLVNKGDVSLWAKYCNSLRLRMLTRVSDASAFSARATSEIASILGNPAKYPVIATNMDNVQINVLDLNTSINSNGFRTGLEDWNGNVAPKAMIDHMKTNVDPRLRYVFEPGMTAAGVYTGLDQLANADVQTPAIAGGKLAMYNRTTLSRNQFFPGVVMNAAEVSFMAAESYVKAGNTAAAKTAYEKGIRESISYYVAIRALSKDATSPAVTAVAPAEITAYLAANGISFDKATTPAARIGLIAAQKWLHMNVVQPVELWSEVRRLDPALSFQADGANAQTKPPVRWSYPVSETIYNKANYAAVSAKDNLNQKLFWDVK